MLGRLSSLQRFNDGRDHIVLNQSQFAGHTMRLNTGQRLLNNYDEMGGSKDLIQVTGLIEHAKKLSENHSKAATELELAESALGNMKDILDQIKTDAIQGGSDTTARDDLEILGVQLRNLGENLYQLANTKLGNKFIFGGKQSDITVVDYVPNGLFNNADYKEAQTDLGERSVEGIQSSISLQNIFSKASQAASYTGTAFTSPLAANAELNLVVNDGKNDINLGDIAFASGDTITDIINKINTAFTTAGGAGTIVSNNAGKLAFTTSTITNSIDNASAAIIVNPGNTLPNSLSSLGLRATTEKGVSGDIREALARLDTAYNTNDSAAIRSTIIDIQENLDRLINAQAKLGDLVRKFNDSEKKNLDNVDALKTDQANIAKIPVVDAIQKVSVAQTVLNSSLQASAAILKMNIFDFISI